MQKRVEYELFDNGTVRVKKVDASENAKIGRTKAGRREKRLEESKAQPEKRRDKSVPVLP